MPKVSVISGAYNIAACYSLDISIRSILAQSYADIEFIICDDGSTDSTRELLQKYAACDDRIKIIFNETNLGLAASLNKCILASTGEYIARHDLDDYNDPTRLNKQIQYMEEHPDVALLGTSAYLFDELGVWGKESYPLKVKNEDFLFTSPYKHGSVIFRRDALLKAGCYRVAKETRRAEDYDLFMRIQTFAKGENLAEPLYYFCEDKNTFSRRKYKYRIDEFKVRFKGFKSLGLLPRGLPYVVKPLFIGLIPGRVLKLHKNHTKRIQPEEHEKKGKR